MRGKKPRKIDLTLAELSADVYRAKGEDIGKWRPLSTEELSENGINPGLLNDDKTGFRANIYANGNGEYVLAYAGTDFRDLHGDWDQANIPQAFGRESAQYQDAIKLTEQVKKAFYDRAVITEHSLGGGLASVASIVTTTPSVTFNASGINDGTLMRAGLDPDATKLVAKSGLIRSYHVNNEILTWEQEEAVSEKWLLPDALGHEIELPNPIHPNPFTLYSSDPLSEASRLKYRIDSHSVSTVLKAIENAKGKNGLTLMIWALINDKPKEMGILLEAGVDPMQHT